MAEPDPQDLQNRIAMLQGQIQRHKQATPVSHDSTYKHSTGSYRSTYRDSHGYSPYNQYHRAASSQPFRNRTLIVKNHDATDDGDATNGSSTPSDEANALKTSTNTVKSDWVSTKSRNAQIINSAVYNPSVASDRVLDPAAKIRKQAQAIRAKLSSGDLHDRQCTVNGIKYSVQAGGSKLVRVKGVLFSKKKQDYVELVQGLQDTIPTPKQVVLSGISYLRSKNGNLYRSSVITRNRNSFVKSKKSELCRRFTNTGTCAYGPRCPYIHDATKIAVCREFLKSGSCSQGQHCDLSHDLTYERVPACVHFVRGGCTKDNCPYPHVRVNPAAPVCRAFTTFGYCSKGVECKDKHVFECPDYAEGKCINPKCRLPHVDRAGQLRQQVSDNPTTSNSSPGRDSMVAKSEDQTPLDSGSDIDSEDEVMMNVDGSGFSQEQDFLKF